MNLNLKNKLSQKSSLSFSLRFFLSSLFFFFLTAFPAFSFAEIIRSINIENQLAYRRSDIESIIRMKVGDEFQLEDLENAINDLRKWGVFEKVEVLLQHENDAVDVTFQLEDAFLIKDVQIEGNYPLLEKKVRRAVFLSPGDIYDHEKIPEQIDRLLSFYEKEGYRNTSVFIREDKDLIHRTVVLIIQIKKGRGYRINNVEVQGNTVFKDSRIRNKIGRLFDYSPNRVKKDLENIQDLYRAHDYPRVRVKVTNLNFNEEKRTVDFTIEVREGKKVEVHFLGNEKLSERRLRKGLSLFETGDIDDFELEHSKNQLLSLYRSMGFEETKINVEKEEVSDQEIQITFKIEEGPKRVIKSINFEGNEAFSDHKLKEQMATKEQSFSERGVFIEELFKQDLQTIESFYQQHGFLEAKVEDWKRSLIPTQDKYEIEVDLKEGEKTKVEKLSFSGLTLFKPEEIKKFLLVKEGNSYSAKRLEEDVRAILVYYANHGYPYTEAKTQLESLSPHQVQVHYEIQEGPEVRVGKILFVGNLQTKASTLRKALHFKEGDLFNPQEILRSQVTLRKLGVFDGLSLETLGLKGKEEVVHVVVRVEEKKSQIVDVGFSYDTDTSFKVRVSASRLNLMGWAKHLDARFTVGDQLNRGEFIYTDPRLLGTDWQFLTNTFAQFERRPFFQDFQAGGSAALFRDFTRRLSMLTKYQITYTDFLEDKTRFDLLDPNTSPGTADNITGSLQYSLTYDRRDNFGDPRSGFYASGYTNFGTQFQGTNSYFFKMGTRFGHWWSPLRWVTVANALRVDGIVPLTDQSIIPTQELIFLGGDDTVRGFKEDAIKPTGGKLGIVHNLELQLRLFGGFQLVGFLDSGSLTDRLGEIGFTSFRHSAGIGLHYVTPVGPIRIDYGFVLDPKVGEERKRLHFTFGYFF